MVSHVSFPTPPTTGQCEHFLKIACYSPLQFQTAYDMKPLYRKGDDGSGQTIVIVDSYGYQNIRGELPGLRQVVRPACAPELQDHPAGRRRPAV